MGTPAPRRPDSFSVRSLKRGLDILRLLNRHNGLTVTETADQLNLPRPTAFRLLRTLERLGYIFRDEADKKYRLTDQVRSLSHGYDQEEWLPKVARPIMVEICKKILWPLTIATNMGSHMLVRDSTHDVSPFAMWRHRGGFSVPLLHTAAGQVYLAFSNKDVRQALIEQALSEDSQSLAKASTMMQTFQRGLEKVAADGHAAIKVPDQNHCAFSVPIMVDGEIFAVLSVSFYPTTMSLKQAIDTFAAPLKDGAARIGKSLSAWRAERGG
ncbi:MAG: winged helix-turn-helix transcriptional regulator [Rhodospirillaceae bacterium]|nr:winged helix-turn-helix transcriptional regulator [Rhodospirillaceae bacterium]